MESDEQRPKVVPHFAVSLAACHWYLNGGGKHVMTGDWSELRPLWLHQAEALAPLMRKVATLEELIVMVSPAWPLEVGEGGVVVCLRSGAVIFGGDSVTFDPSDGASEEEEEEEGEEEEVISIRRRQPVLPQVFPVQNDAFAAADILPPGFLWVWARDTYNGRKGSKQYVVAGLDDFWTYYRGVPAEKRNFYELIRRGPLCFHADLEYSLKLVENASLEPEPMVEAIKRLVTEQWEEEMDGMELDQSKWELTESCDHEKTWPFVIIWSMEPFAGGSKREPGQLSASCVLRKTILSQRLSFSWTCPSTRCIDAFDSSIRPRRARCASFCPLGKGKGRDYKRTLGSATWCNSLGHLLTCCLVSVVVMTF
jgi:hypothetical protein